MFLNLLNSLNICGNNGKLGSDVPEKNERIHEDPSETNTNSADPGSLVAAFQAAGSNFETYKRAYEEHTAKVSAARNAAICSQESESPAEVMQGDEQEQPILLPANDLPVRKTLFRKIETLYIAGGVLFILFLLYKSVGWRNEQENTESVADTIIVTPSYAPVDAEPAAKNPAQVTATAISDRLSNLVDTSLVFDTVATAPQLVIPKEAVLMVNEEYEDDDEYTAAETLQYFFTSISKKKCEDGWEVTRVKGWHKNWFCSDKAYEFTSDVRVYSMEMIKISLNNITYHVTYHSDDLYNSHKCHDQDITLSLQNVDQGKRRWFLTRMKNRVPPIACKPEG